MIMRQMTEKLLALIQQYPVIGVVGPRQSGKTTLVRYALPNHKYVTMEDLDKRTFALEDPRRFFSSFQDAEGVIIDEIQEAPELLSYMQGIVDSDDRPGRFVVTGSQNILVGEKITQTLAGRIAILTLLPLTVQELKEADKLPQSLEPLLLTGCYPRLYTRQLSSSEWFSYYITTYVERDVRHILKITDLFAFQHFLKLCAGRVGQLINFASLANDCGIAPNTAKAWISLLQASYIIFLVQPYYKNFNKRVIKAPKMYFYDTGLCCSLLEITDPEQLVTHYMRGALFESFVMSECCKYFFNQGKNPQLYFWRDTQGNEVDGLLTKADDIVPFEIKSGMTINTSFFDGLKYWKSIAAQSKEGFVVYAGDEHMARAGGYVLSWRDVVQLTNVL